MAVIKRMIGAKKSLLLTFSALFLLSSCSETKDISMDKSSLTDLSELKKNASVLSANILSMKLDNFSFTDSIELNIPDKVGKYQLVCMDHFQDKAEDVFKTFAPEGTYSKANISETPNTYPLGPDYSDPENGVLMSVGCTGFFYRVKPADQMTEAQRNTVTSFESGSSVRTADKAAMDSRAAELIGKVRELNEKYSSLAGGISCSEPFTFIEHSDSGVFEINNRTVFREIPINQIMKRNSSEDGSLFSPYSYYYTTAFYDDKGELLSYRESGAFEEYKTVEEYDSILSPEKAVSLLSEKLSGYRQREIIGIELVYVAEMKENIEQVGENEKTQRENAPWSLLCSYDVIELKPYWAVYFDLTKLHETVGFIDCISGDVEFVNNTV